jgi:NOL1/NOP2/sun family putative RNA methylase
MLPEQFLKRMQELLGTEYAAFVEAMEKERHQALRLNPLKIGAEGISAARRFGGADTGRAAVFAHLTKVPWAADGYYYEATDQPGKHPFHEAGLYYIQEPSAMVPAELLGVQPGERVLDLCAAPGGKSTQIAAGLGGKGILFCNEIHPARARILSENIERMGIGNACVTNETPERLAERFEGFFDRILVDAPCSGEGMFRKNEAACGEWSLENIKLCAQRQDAILDCGARMLRQGGRLVYSTCTFAPEENEGSICRFLKRHEDFALLPVDKERLGLKGCDGCPGFAADPAAGLEESVRIWPHKIDGEGHFAAVLWRKGNLPGDRNGGEAPGGIRERAAEELTEFCRSQLRLPVSSHGGEGIYAGIGMAVGMEETVRAAWFGENLYLVAADLPTLKGLKVLRPGLQLGTFKKKRFEPSHALALALAPGYAAHVWNLEAGSRETAAYLRGETFPAGGEKGWYLICVEGFGLGWGKLAGGVMKNHYPIGLRRKC